MKVRWKENMGHFWKVTKGKRKNGRKEETNESSMERKYGSFLEGRRKAKERMDEKQ